MKKQLSCLLAVLMLIFSLAACQKKANAAEPDTSYTGTVTAVSAESITLSTEDGEVVIPLAENTVFTYDMGFGGQGMDGSMTPPDGMDIPDGAGQMGEPPEASGNMGQIPEGTDGMSELPEMPSDMGQIPEGTDGMNELPEMPSDMGQIPEGTDGMSEQPEMPSDMQEMPEMSGDMAQLPEGSGTMQPMTGGFGGNMPTLTYADIAVDDTITVTTDENGDAASVILPMDMSNLESMEPNGFETMEAAD